ncbi:glycosyltransferase [Aquamicrobium zhengzhouense]|uniref:Glycosyltransferase family 1 protein n=1 Tax=Aquamicrobium zhengzhouense TaxID=2781738 RepID=A0ABS0SIB7_9HYPH|nr:glycosyltransferase [Aquamicrobium zhengzhouense]MBI1622375.1 glycosyltransferase family 1 protein [Aquamicrobium zhengzhouense]
MRIALICPPYPSHVQVFSVLASALQERGHEAVLVLQEGAEAFAAGKVRCVLIPPASGRTTEQLLRRAARPGSILGVLKTVADSAAATDALCQHLPEILQNMAIEAVIADQMEPAGALAARHRKITYLSLACALPLERDARIPPPYLGWPYAADEAGLKRNRGGEMVASYLLSAQRRMIRKWAARFGLENLETLEDCLSPLGTIAQMPKALDFPREDGGRPLWQMGPIRAVGGKQDFALEIDPNRPLVFMSLGTLQGHRFSLFRAVARVCKQLDAQLLVAHCGGLRPDQAARVGADWVTDFVPQREVLARADICVTHGGQNTVLDALEAGTPLLVTPIAFDQPGISARIVHHQVGIRLSHRFLRTGKAKRAMQTLLQDASYKSRARALGSQMQPPRLADIGEQIEEAFGSDAAIERQSFKSSAT